MTGICIGSLLVIFLGMLIIFGARVIRNIGGDFSESVKSFREGLKEETNKNDDVL